jgi:hypothetical protein
MQVWRHQIQRISQNSIASDNACGLIRAANAKSCPLEPEAGVQPRVIGRIDTSSPRVLADPEVDIICCPFCIGSEGPYVELVGPEERSRRWRGWSSDFFRAFFGWAGQTNSGLSENRRDGRDNEGFRFYCPFHFVLIDPIGKTGTLTEYSVRYPGYNGCRAVGKAQGFVDTYINLPGERSETGDECISDHTLSLRGHPLDVLSSHARRTRSVRRYESARQVRLGSVGAAEVRSAI